ncbi:MAG: Trm112 family protein [Pseudomonadota bacterium]
MSDTTESRADPRMLELLICPISRKPLEYDREAQELISKSVGLAYPIRDGLPILLEEAARVLDEEPGG